MDIEALPSTKALVAQLDEAIEKHAQLEEVLLDGQNLTPVRQILERLGRQRAQINEAQVSLDDVQQEQEQSDAAQSLYGRISDLTGKMRLDLETLYIFGNMALDQWAYAIAYLRGVTDPEGYKFEHFYIKLQSKGTPVALQEFKDHHLKDVIWLRFHIRMYRNTFIEHIDRPWQRGTTMTLHGDDFKFFIPAAVGWVSESQKSDIITKAQLEKFAPERLKQRPKDYWEWQTPRLLEVVFNQIDEVERQVDRERIEDAWKLMGGSTVSYLVLAQRLISFLSASIDTIVEQVAADRNSINFGLPELGGVPSNG